MAAKVGSDLEYAVRHMPTMSFVPAGVLPISGTKGNPEPLNHGGLEIDCCAVEITPNPGSDEDEFTSNILQLLSEVHKRFEPMQYQFIAKPSLHFPVQVLVNTPYAMTMGCSPDHNAWTNEQNNSPDPETTLRTFGGHIHIEDGNRNTIMACDLLLGMWSVLDDLEGDERRQLYGKAGAFRRKSYGVEYRVLSNWWAQDEAKIRKAYQLVQTARRVENAKAEANGMGGPERIQEIINKGLRNEAREVFNYMEQKYAAA